MMVKVIKPFRDKYENVVYLEGQEIEITEERYEELTSTAHGSFVKSLDDMPEQKETVKQKKFAAKKNKSR